MTTREPDSRAGGLTGLHDEAVDGNEHHHAISIDALAIDALAATRESCECDTRNYQPNIWTATHDPASSDSPTHLRPPPDGTLALRFSARATWHSTWDRLPWRVLEGGEFSYSESLIRSAGPRVQTPQVTVGSGRHDTLWRCAARNFVKQCPQLGQIDRFEQMLVEPGFS